MRFPDEAVNTMWSVLAAILHLGNVDFEPNVSNFLFSLKKIKKDLAMLHVMRD